MMRRGFRTLALGVFASAFVGTASFAQSVPTMLDECGKMAQAFFRDWEARSDMRYNGRLSDGTHAVNGRIYLETRFDDVACAFDRTGRTMTSFFADGRFQNAFLPGGTGQPGNNLVEVTGLRGSDRLNVRSGPGVAFRIINALPNGTRVRRLNCQDQGGSRWCQIEMTGQSTRGWVNARFLSDGVATQLPGQGGGATQLPGQGGGAAVQLPSQPRPPQAGTGATTTVRVRFAPGTSGALLPGRLAPGESKRYLLSARNLQELRANLLSGGNGIFFQVFNPDGTILQDQLPPGREYRGQLWQTGEHAVEVINRSNIGQVYSLSVQIR